MFRLFFMISLCIALFSCSSDDATSDVTFTSVETVEGNNNSQLTFVVDLGQASDTDLAINYRTTDETALAGLDYVPSNGVLNIPAGQSSGNISVTIIGDDIKEADESFVMTLSGGVSATANGTISNDDTREDQAFVGYTSADNYPGYNLKWSDEFETTSVNMDNWTFEQGNHGWGNNELQDYTLSNTFLKEGLLAIEARKNSNGTYSSARMITADKVNCKYGRIDIRAKLPEGQGLWPALWMLGSNFFTTGWPACGEIDIVELIGSQPNLIHATAHWGSQGSSTSISHTNTRALSGGEKFSDEFHVYSLEWEEDNVRWYIDDVLYHQMTRATVGNSNYPFNQEFFFIMNVAVGGNWPGSPSDNTIFPQRMFVDYIRVFEKE